MTNRAARRATISPRLVGQSFVKQYYDHLSQDTHNLYRFYKDESTFTHGEGSQVVRAAIFSRARRRSPSPPRPTPPRARLLPPPPRDFCSCRWLSRAE